MCLEACCAFICLIFLYKKKQKKKTMNHCITEININYLIFLKIFWLKETKVIMIPSQLFMAPLVYCSGSILSSQRKFIECCGPHWIHFAYPQMTFSYCH